MNIKLKICGMRESDNIREVATLQPDYLGFIFYGNSPRCVPHDFKMPELSHSIKTVAVFVNERPEVILETVGRHKIDFVQLHGSESVEECEIVKQKGVKVIKAFSINSQFDFKVTENYQSVADYFLFDTKGKYYGGNAQTFDWSILNHYNQKLPFFLSGGLSIDNIHNTKILCDMNIHSLDLNSGVESDAGLKNIEKVKAVQRVVNSFSEVKKS